jgi:phosphopantetheinyl transferase
MRIYYSRTDLPKPVSRDLLREAMRREFGVLRFTLRHSDSGAPFVDVPGVYISITHCKTAAAVIVSSIPVGVDMETLRRSDMRLARRICHENELALLEKARNEQQFDSLFTDMWVKKEAYSKMKGKGLSIGFRNIDTTAKPHLHCFDLTDLRIAATADLIAAYEKRIDPDHYDLVELFADGYSVGTYG